MKYLILRGTKVARRKGSLAVGKVKSQIWPTVKSCLLFGLLVGYAFAGATLFYHIEMPAEQARIHLRINQTESLRTDYITNVQYLGAQCGNDTALCWKLFENATRDYELKLQHALDFRIDPREGEGYLWTYWTAFYYSFTIFTTIGYGNIYCHTRWCRIATIVYALFGIPLVLTVLKYLGQSLFLRSSWVWRKLRRLARRVGRFAKEKIGRSQQLTIQRNPSVASSSTMPDIENLESGFPLFLAIAVVLLYIFAVAYAFYEWEGDWDYLDAFYFFFITMSTIGLGDQVPSVSKQGRSYMLGFLLVIVGLALVSMCINVLQNRVEQTYIKTILKMENRFVLNQDWAEQNGSQPPSALSKMAGSTLAMFAFNDNGSQKRMSVRHTALLEIEGDDGQPVMILPIGDDTGETSEGDDSASELSPTKVRFSDMPERLEAFPTSLDESQLRVQAPEKDMSRLASVYDNDQVEHTTNER